MYCNYSKDKYGNEITFVKPHWAKIKETSYKESFLINIAPMIKPNERLWVSSCILAETNYFNLLDIGLKPQDARAVLPNSCKTELIVTGFKSDWDNFLKLRCAKNAHPDMQYLANIIKKYLKEKE